MQIQNISKAPQPTGPYCHAIKTGNLVFCSGQTPLDPVSGKVTGANIQEQTERALQNLEIVLAGMGLSLQNVVKTNVYLKEMADFQAMNAVYIKMFGEHRPARTAIAIKETPLDALVEIECIAEIP